MAVVSAKAVMAVTKHHANTFVLSEYFIFSRFVKIINLQKCITRTVLFLYDIKANAARGGREI